MSGYTAEEAAKMGQTLIDLAKTFPVRAMRYEFHRRGVEWQRAGNELDGCEEGEAVIETANTLTRGMSVVGRDGWLEVVTFNRDGTGFAVDDDGRTVWRNIYGPTSPVVVRA